jgi:carbonic anhydrase/acetyltransferase-like protein (isoleucine patch superfamily)
MTNHANALIFPYNGILPTIHESAFIAPGAVIIGDVHIGPETGVWFGCVIRGDVNAIRIGARTNIQDGTVIHVTRKTGPTTIGSGITIGHQVLLHACTLMDDCFVGMGATIIDGVVVERGAFIAAGSVVTPHKRVPTGQMWGGNPAKYMRDLKPEETAFIPVSAENYVRHVHEYKAQLGV